MFPGTVLAPSKAYPPSQGLASVQGKAHAHGQQPACSHLVWGSLRNGTRGRMRAEANRHKPLGQGVLGTGTCTKAGRHLIFVLAKLNFKKQIIKHRYIHICVKQRNITGVWSSVPMLKQSVSNHRMMCPPSASLGSKAALLLLKYSKPPPLTPEFSNKGLEVFSRENFPFSQCLVKACPPVPVMHSGLWSQMASQQRHQKRNWFFYVNTCK